MISAGSQAPGAVTISASYGAGGSRVGPWLARRLGVPFVDRAIPVAVAAHLDVPVDEALAHEEPEPGALGQLAGRMGSIVQMFAGAPLFPEMLGPDDRDFLAATERVLREQAAGGAVILGRGAAAVLHDDPRVLHVRLDGPAERRVAQAMRIDGLDRPTVERSLNIADASREEYVKHWYDVDPRDPALYHMVIDSTAVELEVCVELIMLARQSLLR
jgi:cytidylate kinase